MVKIVIPEPPQSRHRSKTPWSVKLHKEKEIKYAKTDKGTMLIPRPVDVDALMKQVRKGKLTTVNYLREKLAEGHPVDMTCPLTTGIFVWVVAEAAADELRAGKKQVTPFWRTLKSDGSLNDKYPGGIDYQAAMLQIEGHELLPGKGKKAPKVKNYEKYLAKL
jgi:hypothetical protein